MFGKDKPDLSINLDEFYSYLERISKALERIDKKLAVTKAYK